MSAIGSLAGRFSAGAVTAGLVNLGNVAVYGTRLRANASRHKAMGERIRRAGRRSL
ncbi:MAG: hypothetical protein INF74_08300 [Roseomonas sp.]|nr:hypothetical protein [Roseomonas sp.]